MTVRITSNFDGGNIECLSCDRPERIRLRILADRRTDILQWFYFRLTGARDQDCVLRIENAGAAAFKAGWRDYRAVASENRKDWVRVDTALEGDTLVIRHKPDGDSIYFAYFAPYSAERHADLMAECLSHANVRLQVPGTSIDGQDLDLLRIGDDGGTKLQVWVIARQHPGETMAEWLVEGLLQRLLTSDDDRIVELRERAVFHVVANMNPDGSRRGHLRTNAVGTDLNRAWSAPDADKSPEVHAVREVMNETGVDLFLDVHGDEGLPYVFLVGTLGIPSLSDAQQAWFNCFSDSLKAANPDFQTEYGYPSPKKGNANLGIANNWVAETFGALAMTLEQPFKDAANNPEPNHGYSPARAQALGAASLDAMADVLDLMDKD